MRIFFLAPLFFLLTLNLKSQTQVSPEAYVNVRVQLLDTVGIHEVYCGFMVIHYTPEFTVLDSDNPLYILKGSKITLDFLCPYETYGTHYFITGHIYKVRVACYRSVIDHKVTFEVAGIVPELHLLDD